MGTEQVRQVLQAALEMTFYCQEDELVDHLFCRVLVENKPSVE